jgi:hypothetical protein
VSRQTSFYLWDTGIAREGLGIQSSAVSGGFESQVVDFNHINGALPRRIGSARAATSRRQP